jgi:hypothetical protein
VLTNERARWLREQLLLLLLLWLRGINHTERSGDGSRVECATARHLYTRGCMSYSRQAGRGSPPS